MVPLQVLVIVERSLRSARITVIGLLALRWLDEVIRLCKDEQAVFIFVEAKSYSEELICWYQRKGFELSSLPNI